MVSLHMTIDRRLRARCRELGICTSLVEDVVREPDARQLIADQRFQARRRVRDGRTLVVRYVEEWKRRQRYLTVVHAGYADEEAGSGGKG